MNSDHAPTAEEQLPPLDITQADKAPPVGLYLGMEKEFLERLNCRTRQLLAALRENREKDARIAELEAELDKGDSWAWIRGKFEKCRTQFAWYKPRTDSLTGTRYEVMGWLHVLFAHADPKVYIDITMEHQKKADDANTRAEAAEAKLRAVSDALDAGKNLIPLFTGAYSKADVDAIFARIRAIVEGK